MYAFDQFIVFNFMNTTLVFGSQSYMYYREQDTYTKYLYVYTAYIVHLYILIEWNVKCSETQCYDTIKY